MVLLLECSNLSKAYGEVKALKDVSLALEKGLSLILGPNGSGKTTLLKIISRITEPDKGSIKLFGKSYKEYPAHRIGFSFEKTIMSPRVKVREYLEAMAEYRGENNVDEVTSIFNLEKYQTRRFKELSQGYKRRFLVASAFVGEPEVVFLDEPFSNLDIVSKVELSRAFQEIKKEINIVVVSHIVSGLKNLDSLVLLHNGRVVVNEVKGNITAVGGFRAFFKSGAVVENSVEELISLIKEGDDLIHIEPVTPEDIIYEKLMQIERKDHRV